MVSFVRCAIACGTGAREIRWWGAIGATSGFIESAARAAEVLDREEKDGEELAYECPLCRNKSPEQLAEEARLAEVARAEEERKAQIRERNGWKNS